VQTAYAVIVALLAAAKFCLITITAVHVAVADAYDWTRRTRPRPAPNEADVLVTRAPPPSSTRPVGQDAVSETRVPAV